MGKLTGHKPILTDRGFDESIIAGDDPEFLMVGATLDWDEVPALTTAKQLKNGTLVPAGRKLLERGQFMVRKTGGLITVATQNNTPTGGTKTFTVIAGGQTLTTTALAYNADGAAVQTAIRLLDNVDPASTVTGSASGPYTFTLPAAMGRTSVTANGATLTGAGVQPTVTFTSTSNGKPGWFGRYDPDATDGRATPIQGHCGFIERTIILDGWDGLGVRDDGHKGLITGGHVYRGMCLVVAASPSLIAGPTEAVVLAACPAIKFVKRKYP